MPGPYSIGKHKDCPASKPQAVINKDGNVVAGGCHATHAGALAHQRAMMVNVPGATAALIGHQEDLAHRREVVRESSS